MSRRTPLGRVLGLGAAKEGVAHWWAQRVSATALLPLGLWFVVSVALLIGRGRSDYLAVIDWIAQPFNAVLLILFIVTVAWHSSLGVQVVIEDYVHGWRKVIALILQKFAHVVAAVAAVYAVLSISLGG